MNSLWAKIPEGGMKFKLGDLVRITKENVKFAKGMNKPFLRNFPGCQGYTARAPTFYDLKDLKDSPIEGHLYNYELVKVNVSHQTVLEIDKLVRNCNKNIIKQNFV